MNKEMEIEIEMGNKTIREYVKTARSNSIDAEIIKLLEESIADEESSYKISETPTHKYSKDDYECDICGRVRGHDGYGYCNYCGSSLNINDIKGIF